MRENCRFEPVIWDKYAVVFLASDSPPGAAENGRERRNDARKAGILRMKGPSSKICQPFTIAKRSHTSRVARDHGDPSARKPPDGTATGGPFATTVGPRSIGVGLGRGIAQVRERGADRQFSYQEYCCYGNGSAAGVERRAGSILSRVPM